MWESTAEVTRKAVVQAAPEHTWSLVSDSAAWSLLPGHFAFDVPRATEAAWLRCWFVPFGPGLGSSVQEVREDVPGQVMSLSSPSTHRPGASRSRCPSSRTTAAPWSGSRSRSPSREDKLDYQAVWRKGLKAWLSALADVAEGRRPWPEAGIPAPILRACLGLPLLTSPQGTSAAVLIGASPEAVWRAVRTPGIPADPRQPWTVIAAGRVPGPRSGSPATCRMSSSGRPTAGWPPRSP